jgi:DNA polymerase-3 subunit delta'
MLAAGSSADRLRVHCAEDKREIPVDAIRQLSEKLTLGRQRSAWRVVTVYPAERLSRAAANAFLKTLEEPAPDNLLILVCHDVARLLPTLRSRVQSHALALPSFEQAILWLKDKQPHSAEGHLALALLASQGAPLQALALLQNDGVSEFAQVRDDLLRLMQGRVSPSQLGQAWGEDLLQRLAWSATWCHVWLRQALGENRLPASVSGQGGPLPALPQTWWQQRYEDAVALRRLAQTPTNPQLLAEKYLLAWHAVARA